MLKQYHDVLLNRWSKLKKKLHYGAGCPHISEGEIWWCGVGQNIGVEINGKHSVFSRPVLVLTKLSRFCFLAVPLSTQQKQGSWYVAFTFQDRNETAVYIPKPTDLGSREILEYTFIIAKILAFVNKRQTCYNYP